MREFRFNRLLPFPLSLLCRAAPALACRSDLSFDDNALPQRVFRGTLYFVESSAGEFSLLALLVFSFLFAFRNRLRASFALFLLSLCLFGARVNLPLLFGKPDFDAARQEYTGLSPRDQTFVFIKEWSDRFPVLLVLLGLSLTFALRRRFRLSAAAFLLAVLLFCIRAFVSFFFADEHSFESWLFPLPQAIQIAMFENSSFFLAT